MKKITIVSPETVPLPLKEGFPEKMKEGNKEFFTKDKCIRTTAPGKRSWKFAKYLSQFEDFEVTLLIPNLNMPDKEYIDDTDINFDIKSYNFKSACWEWSEELDRKLIKSDFVIVQSTTGAGFQNASVLPKSVNLILDGWVPFLAELPCVLLNYNRMYRKIFWTKKFMPQYQDLLKRANCVLYANSRQRYYYEGQMYMIQKLDWSSFKFSPMHKIPYGVDKVEKVQKKENNPDILKLLWYGPVYPWYSPETLLKELKNNKEIQIDFVGVEHPRYKKVYDSYFKKFFDEIKDSENIRVIEEYCDDSLELFSNYDAGIILARDWLEEQYSHRCRILEMVSSGFPVIINKGNSLYEEFDFLRDYLHPVSSNSIVNDLLKIKENKEKLEIPDESVARIHQILNWGNVLSPLVDYIRKF